MLEIKCHECGREFWVNGYTTPDTFHEPGEVVVPDSETFEDCCTCLRNGSDYDVIDEEIDCSDDDVI